MMNKKKTRKANVTLDVDLAGVDLGWVRSFLQFHSPRDVFLRFERPTQALRVWPPWRKGGEAMLTRFLCMPRIACSPPGPHPHPISDGRKLATHDTTTATTTYTRHRTAPHRTTPASHLVLHPFQQSFLALPRPAGVVPVPDTVPLQLFLRGHGFVLLAINTIDEVVAFVQGEQPPTKNKASTQNTIEYTTTGAPSERLIFQLD